VQRSRRRDGRITLGYFLLLVNGACATPEPPEAQPRAARPSQATPPPPAASSAPAPSAAPAQTAAPAAQPPANEPGRADLDPENDLVVAPPDPIADCDARLGAAAVASKPASLPIRKSKTGHACGAPQVVVYAGVAGGARIRPAPLVTCGMALALARFETILQEEAERELGTRVASITQLGTYNCREMARFDLVSEHSYANAIDLTAFTLQDGRSISVARHFGKPGTEPTRPEGRFLRAFARRLYDEGVFSVVLTEYFDRLHHDHFHLDMARYRIDGTR
jgi:hypothetical protein